MTREEPAPGASFRRRPGAGGWMRLLGGLVALLALAQVGAFLGAARLRVPSPFPLDWIEGLSTLQALAMERGFPPYHPPHAEAIPPIYTPGLAFVLRGLAAAGARGLPVARAVSVAGILGVLVLGYLMVRREGGRRLDGLVAAALFLGSYAAVDRVYDMARVDSLALFFFALGLWWITAPGRDAGRALRGAVALVLAVYTKQSLGAPALVLLGVHGLRRPRRAALAILAFSVFGVALAASLELWCEGWFMFWTLKVPSTHPVEEYKRALAAGPDLFAAFSPWLLAALPLGASLRFGVPTRTGSAGMAVAATTGAAYVLGYLQRLKVGGHVNVWGLFFFLAALSVGLLLADLRRVFERGAGSTRRGALALRAALLLLVATNLASTLEGPWTAAPEPATPRLTRRLGRLVEELDGRLLCPLYPATVELLGGGPQFSLMPLWDLRYGKISRPVAELRRRVATRRWNGVLLPRGWDTSLPELPTWYAAASLLRLPAMTSGNRYPEHVVWLRRDPRLQPRAVDLGFEGPRFTGFEVAGAAFGPGPTRGPVFRQRKVEGKVGSTFANSFHGGDAATGRLVSHPFVLRGNALALRVGGGDVEGVGCALRVDGREVARARGRGDEVMRPVLWDLREHRGREAVLEVFDESSRGWGHVIVDDVVVVEAPPVLLEDPAGLP